MQLAEIEKRLKEIKELGFNIFGICPDVMEGLTEARTKSNVTFDLLSDSTLTITEAFGLAFHVDDATVKLYLDKYNIDLEKASQQTHHNLPIPAVYIVNAEGTVCFTFMDANHTVRLSTDDLLKEAKAAIK